MKTKLLLIALLAGASLFTYAQSLVLIHEGEELVHNSEIIITGEPTAAEIVVELDVKNTSASNIEANVQRYEDSMVTGTVSTFCWAGLCYPPFVGLSPNTVNIAGGEVHEDDFSGHFIPNGITGESIISYTFFDVNNPNDTTQITIKFQAGTVGIETAHKTKEDVSLYPNPANDNFSIRIDSEVNETINYEIISITGSVVAKETTNSNLVKFNVADLPEGLYLYRVSSESKIIKTGRVVIKR